MSGKPEWDQSLGKDKDLGISRNALAVACLGCVLTSGFMFSCPYHTCICVTSCSIHGGFLDAELFLLCL